MSAHSPVTPAWLTERPIAHRGLHEAARDIVENSPSAALAAIAHRFAIECDVQLTSDGEAVVFHDFTLDRLTITGGALSERSADALGRIAMKAGSDRIPTLRQFLSLIGGRVPLVVELKSRFDGDMRLARRVAEVVADYAGPVALKSFDPEIVAALHPLVPDRPRGVVAMLDYSDPDYETVPTERKHAFANLLHFELSRPDFISWRVRDLPCAAPHLCRVGLRLPVMTWTVCTPEDQARAAEHADQMVFEGFVPGEAAG